MAIDACSEITEHWSPSHLSGSPNGPRSPAISSLARHPPGATINRPEFWRNPLSRSNICGIPQQWDAPLLTSSWNNLS